MLRRVGAALMMIPACSSSTATPDTRPATDGGGDATTEAGTDTAVGPSNALTCESFSSVATNCWAAAIEEARACAPPTSAEGTFSADGKTCTSDAFTVAFDPPFDFAATEFPDPFGFTLDVAGTRCIADKVIGNGLHNFLHRLETKKGVVTVTGTEGALEIVCPDGSRWTNPNVTDTASVLERYHARR